MVAYALASSTLSRCRITRDTTPSSRLKYSSARVWTGMSRRNAPLAAPRSNTARSGAASCRSMRRASRGAFSNRPSARYRPVAAIVARVMRATASSIGTESSRASLSRRVRSDSAASYRAYSSASRLGKYRYSVARATPAACAMSVMLTEVPRSASTVAATSRIPARTWSRRMMFLVIARHATPPSLFSTSCSVQETGCLAVRGRRAPRCGRSRRAAAWRGPR